MTHKKNSILETVGNTPIVRINKLAPDGVNLFAKIEAFNPLGSVKDRLALGLIEHAEQTGRLSPGQTVIEATSGNTGIGLAMVCAQKGYPLVVTMAENFSVERRKMMRFLGAKVILTPASQRGTGMLAKAAELAETHGWYLCGQFENEANADVHSRTTAQEILADFEGERLDYWVTGFGTGGTLKGVARVLKRERPETRIAVCEPDNSRVLASGIPQPRAADGSPTAGHPSFRTHLMQGWAPDFIPKLAGDAQELELIDELLPVSGADALRFSRELARKEGIFTGITGGATLAGALQICESAEPGTTVLCMLPDTGERYLTTPLFDDVATEMSADEIRISGSTPNFRFDVASPAIPVASSGEPQPVSAEAKEFIDRAVGDSEQPVVLFAYEWCEFCWSARRLFARCSIAYRAIDFDSAEYQKNDWGDKILAALMARTSLTTVPQIFVGGELVGGCTELFDAYNDGRLQRLLEGANAPFDRSVEVDPYRFLPTWLHPR